MLMRISLIVAIIAGLAIGGLNFVLVKDKVTQLADDRDKEKGLKETALADLSKTRNDLQKTTAELNTTKQNLEATTAERDRAVAEASSEKKRADTVTVERDKARKERDDAQAELAAYRGTDLKPEEIIAIKGQYKKLQADLDATIQETKILGRKIVALTNELAIYKTPDYVVPLPPGLHGKILVADPKWNFVVLNVGQDQGVLEHGELLVNRNGRLVAKVKVRSVQKDRSIANVLPGWQLGEVMEGDQVIPAHPASS
jgi:hypothetical protein